MYPPGEAFVELNVIVHRQLPPLTESRRKLGFQSELPDPNSPFSYFLMTYYRWKNSHYRILQ